MGVDPQTAAPLPTIPSQVALEEECAPGGTWVEPPCVSEDALQSQASQGTTLSSSLTDARCAQAGEGLTLLARAGNILSKFVGSGFLQIKSGKAFLVSWIPIKISQLWHRYWKGDGVQPALGDPHDFTYGVIADRYGNLYGIQGYATKKSLHVWNFATRMWETIATDQFPFEISRMVPQSAGVEMVGFEPVPVVGDVTDVRELKALMGEGIVYLEKVAVAPPVVPDGCEPCPENAFAYVAKVLEFPAVEQTGEPETGRHQLIYSSNGLYWDAEA